MVFPQIPAFPMPQGNQSFDSGGSHPVGAQDSITLGQLKAIMGPIPKPKQSYYDFRYEDEDNFFNEIDEFYSYAETPHVAGNLKAWQGSYHGDWIKSTPSQRRAHVELILEGIEHRDAEIRFMNARRLLYILQGTFAETTSPEHQLHWIIENCKVVRSANGLSCIVEAMKITCAKLDLLWSLGENDSLRLNVSPMEKHDLIEEFNTELSVYLGMLYLMIEVFKPYDEFSEELMSLEPPLPVYLLGVLAGMKDKTAKGYPVKKLLLVMWKTILACFGGIRELSRVKELARELAGLSPVTNEGPNQHIKSSPFDIQAFRQETTVKYPTFTPEPSGSPKLITGNQTGKVSTAELAQACFPIPIRHHYHHSDDSDHQNGLPINATGAMPFVPHHPNPQYAPNQVPQPLTPAPSPPPTGKKKQQYQTDQTRPFLFPFSQSRLTSKNAPLVPFAIDEADRLYHKHMHVSLALSQMWRTREECMASESGLEHMPGSSNISDAFNLPNADNDLMSVHAQLNPSSSIEEDDLAQDLPDVVALNTALAFADASIKLAEIKGERTEKRKARERKEDLMRLKRVEQVYAAILPVLPGCVVVLLKLLLATVSAGNNMNANQQPPPSATSGGFPPGVTTPAEQQPPVSPPTLEEIDVTRHREIMSKAISAILLLLMKWFKVSHAMKFHHLGQLLLDSNCLLLILKMFGLQEVSTSVASKSDSPDHGFFRYCQLNFAKNSHLSRPEDNMLNPPRQTVTRSIVYPNGQRTEEEVELLTDYSWRNFFSSINFVKIMQKLSKHRSHRIWLLVQYKSSAILKRILKVSHPLLQLHVLKLIKSQVPYCGRKWRQSNMKVITSIYLNCRPDLRDEWLTGTEGDDVQASLAQEQALRKLVKFYNTKRYGAVASQYAGQAHRRSASMAIQVDGLHPGPELSAIRGTPNMVEADVFPPLRSQAPDPSIFLPYTNEDIAFEEEYEEYLSGMSEEMQNDGQLFGGASAWDRLPHIGSEIADGISDSESIVSIGELEEEARMDGTSGESDRESVDENLNNWEHMSPKTMAALPKSPVGTHRRSSSGSSLRPVLPFGLDDASAVDLDEEGDIPELGPAPREPSGPFASGAGVDEVEYAYGV